jgi:hypothetical protein
VTAAAIPIIVMVGTTFAPAASAGVQPNDAFQVDVSNDQSTSAGEPEIAVNPNNQLNMVIAYPLSGAVLMRCDPRRRSPQTHFDWTRGGDAFDGVGRDGTFYAGGVYVQPAGSGSGVALWKSIDGGWTWTGPVTSIGADASADSSSRGYLPPGAVYDRPWLAVDAHDGRVYSSGRSLVTNEAFVAPSYDHAQTFSRVQSFDDANYQAASSIGTNASISAAHGLLAAAYAPGDGNTAVSDPALGPGCQCVIFETSADGGATWIRHLIPGVTPVIGGGGQDLSCPQVGCVPGYLAADPARVDNYAFLMDSGSQSATDGAGGGGYDIYLTSDGGAHWAKTAFLSDGPEHHSRPWLAYGPNGTLGAMWRSDNNGNLDVYAAMSLDGGHTFSSAIKVSQGSGPYTTTGSPDDSSAIAIGTDRVYIAWGDARKGSTAVFFASVPLSMFAVGGPPVQVVETPLSIRSASVTGWNARRGSNSRPLPWQGTASNERPDHPRKPWRTNAGLRGFLWVTRVAEVTLREMHIRILMTRAHRGSS